MKTINNFSLAKNTTLDNKLKTNVVSVMNMLLIYILASMNLEKVHKNCLVLVLTFCYTMIFYETSWNILRDGGLNKNEILFIGKECV